MKLSLFVLLTALLAFSSLSAAHDWKDDCDRDDHESGLYSDCDVDWDEEDGTLTLTSEEDEDETVVITKEYKLIVNGEEVKTSRKQKGLVRDYYKGIRKLHRLAAEIGAEGAELGAKGGKIAELALKNICKLLGDEKDQEEYESVIEREAEKLEAEAEKLEEKAEVLEEIAEKLEGLHYEMKDSIPELRDLDWL
jgi:hypothetical protein